MTMKRFAAPAFWPIERKTKKFVISPRPGPHAKNSCIPLGVALRDVLGYARNSREAADILKNGHVKIDGVVRKEKGFPLGLMDVVSVGNEHYRMVPTYRGLRLISISEKDSRFKLLRIRKKTSAKRKKIQLNFHDGKNMLEEKDGHHTGDVVLLDLEKNAIKETLKFESGMTALIIGGSNKGLLCRIEDVIVTRNSMPNQIVVDVGGRKIVLPRDYVFVVGKDVPAVKIGDQA